MAQTRFVARDKYQKWKKSSAREHMIMHGDLNKSELAAQFAKEKEITAKRKQDAEKWIESVRARKKSK